MTDARLFVVVPAAGGGARFGGDVPKQYADLDGAPVLARTLDRLSALQPQRMFVALSSDDREYERRIGVRNDVLPLRCGGSTRAATVRNALDAIAADCGRDDWVAVHDAVRPCVPVDALLRLVATLASDRVGGLLAVPLADTLKRADGERVARTENRESLWHAQTPQMFRYAILVEALRRDMHPPPTDEAQAVEAIGARPRLVRGSAANVKITYGEDLALAEAIWKGQRP